jgi:zinc protease
MQFYKRYYVGKNATLVMVGAIDSKQAHQLAQQLTADLVKGEHAKAIPQAGKLDRAATINIPFPSSQTIVRMGQIGIDHHHPDYFPLMVGNYILGGGSLVSRLSIEVREKRGLTYGVDSQFMPMPGEGPFIIGLSTRNNQAGNALNVMVNTLNLFINDGPDEQEIKAAKSYLTGSFPLSLSGNRTIASLLLRMAFYHLPDDYLDTYAARINAVTADEIKQAFRQQINPDKMLLVTVGEL